MKIKQPYEEPRIVPDLGDRLIGPGEVVTLRDPDLLANFLEAGWEPADQEARSAAKEIREAKQADAAGDDAEPVDPAPEPDPDAEAKRSAKTSKATPPAAKKEG